MMCNGTSENLALTSLNSGPASSRPAIADLAHDSVELGSTQVQIAHPPMHNFSSGMKACSLTRKSLPSGHDPMGGYRFSLGTNAKRLPGDHAQTKRWSGRRFEEKSSRCSMIRKRGTGFPKRSCSNKKTERENDSKKSHPAREPLPFRSNRNGALDS